jgi:acylphosphatase
MSSRSVRVLVTGRVQGVGFRWFVRERARALKLEGWVRNRSDGAVEVAARGPGERVEYLVVALRQGPPASNVLAADVTLAPPDEDFPSPFEVRH